MKTKILINLIVMLAAIGFSSATAAASDKNELKQRSEKRYPEIRRLKVEGIIGETSEGFVEVVEGKDASAEVGKLVDAENSDRRELYEILAKEGNTSADEVARSAAKRNFDRAQAGEFLKENGKWRKK